MRVDGKVIELGSKARTEFVAKVVELGYHGLTPIPKSDRASERAQEAYRRYETQMDAKFKEPAEERSADPKIQSRIVRELWKLFYAFGRAGWPRVPQDPLGGRRSPDPAAFPPGD